MQTTPAFSAFSLLGRLSRLSNLAVLTNLELEHSVTEGERESSLSCWGWAPAWLLSGQAMCGSAYARLWCSEGCEGGCRSRLQEGQLSEQVGGRTRRGSGGAGCAMVYSAGKQSGDVREEENRGDR